MCLNFNNDWVVCLTQDLLKQQPSNTLSPVTDQNSESKYMNTAVSQTTAPTGFSFRLARKPARLVPTLR